MGESRGLRNTSDLLVRSLFAMPNVNKVEQGHCLGKLYAKSLKQLILVAVTLERQAFLRIVLLPGTVDVDSCNHF